MKVIRTRSLRKEKVMKFLEENYRKNRTIVTKDNPRLLKNLEQIFDIPIQYHRYPTGQDHGTWVVPPEWNVREAYIKDSKGNIMASYDEHPLFVCMYSAAVNGKFTKKELEKHVYFNPQCPTAFAYNHRLAFDPNVRLKDWCISIPYSRWQEMDNGPYEVLIDTQVGPSEMLVGEITVPGKSKETVLFVADYCHPGQVNDSFSGLVMLTEVMQTLSKQKDLHYTYTLLVLPEVIGSSIYMAAQSYGDKRIVGGLFSDDIAWGEKWYLKQTRKANTYMDLLAEECARIYPDLNLTPFLSVIGNDEHVLDSVQTGIPTLSLQKFPFAEYHTSLDVPSLVNMDDLQHAYDVTMSLIDLCERDAIYNFTHSVPFHMSRYNLYADYTYEHEAYITNRKILSELDGQNSLLEIANKLEVPFERVESYAVKMLENGLIARDLRSPFANRKNKVRLGNTQVVD